MREIDANELKNIYAGAYHDYCNQDWAVEWRKNYAQQVRKVQEADWETWQSHPFQENLWDSNAVASIGPGQAVTVRGAYDDSELVKYLFNARGLLNNVAVEEKGAKLQKLYEEVLEMVHGVHAKRRPRARLTRLLASMFPDDMTSIADANRIWGVQKLISAPRVGGHFIAQHPTVREAIRKAIGDCRTVEQKVDQAIFAWYLWQSFVSKPDEGAINVQAAAREANSVPPFSILPANAQRRSLTCVRGNIELLLAIVREAEQGISRDDLVNVILSEATQLNQSSAGNIVSQAMGGLGLLRLDGSTYRPTDRGQELLTVDDPATVLRGPLIGRVFGMGHLLLMVRREPALIKPLEAAKRLQKLVPTWTSTMPGSHICNWARLVELLDVQEGGQLVLTDEGEDYAASLPENFEADWRLEPPATPLIAREAEGDDSQVPRAGAVALYSYDAAAIAEEGCFLSIDEIKSTVELLRRKKNLILQGPPGTGKTWLAKRLGYALIGSRDPQRLTAVQFQPTLSYEDFVRGWRPDGSKGLQLVDGVFLDAIAAANEDPTTPYVLVIEEINRGNPAQILGEMLTLIEDGKRMPEEALRLAYPRFIDERVFVPDNLYIIGTMNLADRSLALVDLALRRRFSFLTLSPQFNWIWKDWMMKKGASEAVVNFIADRMKALNEAICNDRSLGENFQVGHSFMTPTIAPGLSDEEWMSWYSQSVKSEIKPLLREYWFDNLKEADAQAEHLEKL